MAGWEEAKQEHQREMWREVKYLEEILHSLEAPPFCAGCDLTEIDKKQKTILNTLRGDFAMRMTDLEQRMKSNAIRIFGVDEKPEEDTLAVVMEYFNMTLQAGVSLCDIDCCFRVGTEKRSKSRPIVVVFVNDDTRKKIWEKKEKVNDGVHIYQDLCYERNEVRKTALEVFGRDRVRVVDGVVQVHLDCGHELKFYTMLQILDYLKQVLWKDSSTQD